jgi:ferritin-like protein
VAADAALPRDQINDQRHDDRRVADRLLKAWRGEVLTENVYELVARRLPARQAELMRRIAQVEDTHRLRLEQRMHELGIHVPDRGSVKVRPVRRDRAASIT